MNQIKEIRMHYSNIHLESAIYFANLIAEIEERNKVDYSEQETYVQVPTEHRTLVTGSIFAIVAFLESTINEVFADASDKHGIVFKNLHTDTIKLLANVWEDKKIRESLSIMEKFQKALKSANKKRFTKFFTDINLLITLRNRLVHYDPDWETIIAIGDLQFLEKQRTKNKHQFLNELKEKFPLNPFTGLHNPFFPDKCLGHGCALWAINSSISFANEFFEKMGIPINFDQYRVKLKKD